MSGTNPTVFLNEYSYKKGTEIYGEKEPAEYVYQVKIGAVRSHKMLSDGRRLIGAFHLVGDIFGSTDVENHHETDFAPAITHVRSWGQSGPHVWLWPSRAKRYPGAAEIRPESVVRRNKLGGVLGR
jgi:hypothetical protein